MFGARKRVEELAVGYSNVKYLANAWRPRAFLGLLLQTGTRTEVYNDEIMTMLRRYDPEIQ